MPTLSASFRKIRAKLKSHADDKVRQRLLQQSRRRNFKISNSSKISSMSTLPASFTNIWSKLKEFWWWQALSQWKSLGLCVCHFKQGFHWNSMKTLHVCHQSPPEVCYRCENIEICLQTLEMIKGADGRRTNDERRTDYYPLSSPGAFGPGELKKLR